MGAINRLRQSEYGGLTHPAPEPSATGNRGSAAPVEGDARTRRPRRAAADTPAQGAEREVGGGAGGAGAAGAEPLHLLAGASAGLARGDPLLPDFHLPGQQRQRELDLLDRQLGSGDVQGGVQVP